MIEEAVDRSGVNLTSLASLGGRKSASLKPSDFLHFGVLV